MRVCVSLCVCLCVCVGTLVSFTRKLISSPSFHRLDMTLALAEALNPNNPIQSIQIYFGSAFDASLIYKSARFHGILSTVQIF